MHQGSHIIDEGSEQMIDFGFSRLPGSSAQYDEDGNSAVDFKVSGNTATVVNNSLILVLKGFNDQGSPTAVVKPEKYMSVNITHQSGVPFQPWYRVNEDQTLAFGFFASLVGDYEFTITLVGNPLFKATLQINPAGEEQKWVTKMEMPQLGRVWTIDVVRTDGTRPKGKMAFEVETEGHLTNLNLKDMEGAYQITCVPVSAGPVKIHVRLEGTYINGSPVELFIAPPGGMMGVGVGATGVGGRVAQPGPMQPMQPMQPMNVQAMKPMNAQPMNPNSQKPVVVSPRNPNSTAPVVMQPVNAKPLTGQPIQAQPIQAKPISAKAIQATPINAGSPAPASSAAASSQGASDALADLLNELGGI